jgi:hypothetical protein
MALMKALHQMNDDKLNVGALPPQAGGLNPLILIPLRPAGPGPDKIFCPKKDFLCTFVLPNEEIYERGKPEYRNKKRLVD